MFDKGQKQSSTLSCDSSYLSIMKVKFNVETQMLRENIFFFFFFLSGILVECSGWLPCSQMLRTAQKSSSPELVGRYS